MLLFAAAPPSVGRDRGVATLRLEFDRDGASAPRAALDEAYAQACTDGWAPACHPERWRPSGRSSLAAAGTAMAEYCTKGDPGACTVVGWAADAEGRQGGPEAVTRFRQAARLWKTACDTDGFQPACYEYAGLLYENRGVVADPEAGTARWKSACDKGEAESCVRMAGMSRAGGPGVRKDAKQASILAARACSLGSLTGCDLVNDLTPPADPLGADQELCKKGLRSSCIALGGTGDTAVGSSTFEWVEVECTLGDGAACGRSARALAAFGDADKAADRWDTACLAGDVAGCTELARLLTPATLPDHPQRFADACELGGAVEACTELGIAKMDGVVKKDPLIARDLLLRGCTETTGVVACAALGRGYEAGLVGERDRTQAVKYYGQACAQGDLASCEQRGDLLVEGVGVRRDDGVALGNYQQACDGGVARACRKAAKILDEGTQLPRDAPRAVGLYRQACTGSDIQGCFGLGRLLEEGAEGAADYAGAREAYQKAVDADMREARSALSRLLWNGLGGARQGHKAKVLARQACQEGDLHACQGPQGL